jgi:acetylornithine deacetylase
VARFGHFPCAIGAHGTAGWRPRPRKSEGGGSDAGKSEGFHTLPLSGLSAAEAGDPVALTRALVAIPSVNPALEADGAGEAAVAGYCARCLAEWGFAVETVDASPGRTSVVARHGDAGTGPTLLFNGHLDTVGVEGMTVPPFEGVLTGGRIVGRGACDMKAGVAALMAAARRLVLQGHGGQLVVALTADEEHASCGMAALIERGLRADAAVVCEPTDLAVMPAHKGFAWYEVAFRGRAAHGSRPEVGVDAIRHAGLFLSALDDLDRELSGRTPHPLLGHGSLHAGTISGGVAPSVYPERCVLTLERRTLPGEDPSSVRAEVEQVLARAAETTSAMQASLVQTLVRPATEVEGGHPLVRGLLEALSRQGRTARIAGMTAWVDAAFLNEAGTPTVCFGPGSIAQAHGPDEWVEVDQITACADILVDFGSRLLQTGIP